MKRFSEIILSVVLALWTALEFLAIPALLIVCGLLNHFGAAYYIISIAVYLVLFAVVYVIAQLIRKGTNKLFSRLFGKYFGK